jgi:hypothetical protein
MITVPCEEPRGAVRVAIRRPLEDVDDVTVALVDDRGHLPAIEVIQAPALQGKALVVQVLDRWREGDPAVEPRLDLVLL